jgi:SAM-dependent methyltransferase
MDLDSDDLPVQTDEHGHPGSVAGVASDQKSGSGAPSASLARRIGVSFRQSYARRVADGFVGRYLSGTNILDIGYRGGDPEAVPITETAIGIELDYPGYDGTHLPFPADSQDAVLAAHVLEHIPNYQEVLQDWYRVLRVGGYLVIMVPHRYLYERRCDLPSRWNGDHKRFYTPGRLLAEIEESLPINGFRIRHLADNDFGYDYERPLEVAPLGCYEIELVVEKIKRPAWADKLVLPPEAQRAIANLDSLIFQAVAASLRDGDAGQKIFFAFIKELRYFTPWVRLRQRFVTEGAPELDGVRVNEGALVGAVRPLLDCLCVDEAVYGKYADLQAAVAQGKLSDLTSHWRRSGYFAGRVAHEFDVFS